MPAVQTSAQFVCTAAACAAKPDVLRKNLYKHCVTNTKARRNMLRACFFAALSPCPPEIRAMARSQNKNDFFLKLSSR